MNESFKQALKIALGVVLLCAEGVAIYVLTDVHNNMDKVPYSEICIGLLFLSIFLTFIWVHSKCKEEHKADYDLLFKGLSIAAPGLAIAMFDIIPQKWIIYLNAALYVAIVPFAIWLIFFS